MCMRMLIFFGGCMKKIEELRRYFTKGERALWFGSVFVIIAAFYFFG